MPDRRLLCCACSASDALPPAPEATEEEGVPPEGAALRDELATLKPSALTKRAAGEGIDAEEIKQAKDSGDPKQALIELIVVAAATGGQTPAGAARLQALRDELSALKPSELEERALAAGVDAEQVEEAVDGDAPKQALTELILAAEPPTTAAQDADDATEAAALRDELAALKPSALTKRTLENGVDVEKIKQAKDSADPKQALIELIVAAAGRPMSAEAARLQALRDELGALKPSELEERARAAGINAEQVEEAVDGDAPKQMLTELLITAAKEDTSQTKAVTHHPVFRALAAQQLEQYVETVFALGVKHVRDLEELTEAEISSVQMGAVDRAKFLSAFVSARPHMGVPPKQSTGEIAAGGFTFDNGMHCMLSYGKGRAPCGVCDFLCVDAVLRHELYAQTGIARTR